MPFDSLVRIKQLNKPEVSGYIVDVLLQYLKTGVVTGIALNTGQLTGEFYPLRNNPSGYVTTGQLTGYATKLDVTGNNVALLSYIDSYYYPRYNPSGYIGTGYISTGLLPRSGTTFHKTESFTLSDLANNTNFFYYKEDTAFQLKDLAQRGIINFTPGDTGGQPYISGFDVYARNLNGYPALSSGDINRLFVSWDYFNTGLGLSFNDLFLNDGTRFGELVFNEGEGKYVLVGNHDGFPSEQYIIDLYGRSASDFGLTYTKPCIIGFDIDCNVKSSGYQTLTTQDLTGLVTKSELRTTSGILEDEIWALRTELMDEITGASGAYTFSGAGTVKVIQSGTHVIISGSSTGISGNFQGDGTYVRTSGNQNITGNKNFYDNFGNISVQMRERLLYGSEGFQSVSWDGRQVYDVNNHVSIEWGPRYLRDTGNNITVDWQSGWLKSGANITVDWNKRHLSGKWNVDGLTISGNPALTGAYLLTRGTQNYTGTLNVVSGALQVSGVSVTTGGPWYPRSSNPSGYITATGMIYASDDFDPVFFHEYSGTVLPPIIDIVVDQDVSYLGIPSYRYILQVQGYKTGELGRIVYSQRLSSGYLDNPGNFNMNFNWNPIPNYPGSNQYILTLYTQPYGGGGPVGLYPTGAWALSSDNKNGIDYTDIGIWHSGTTGDYPQGVTSNFVTWTGFIVQKLQVTGLNLTGNLILSGIGGLNISSSGNVIYFSGGAGGSGSSSSSVAGVTGIAVSGYSSMTGYVQFVGGSGITLSQTGNAIQIGSTSILAAANSYLYTTGISTGITNQFISFPVNLGANPTVLVSVASSGLDIIPFQISEIYSSGFNLSFADTVSGSGFNASVFAATSTTTGLITTIISNNTIVSGFSPTGGISGQALIKNSSTNYDATWQRIPMGRVIMMCAAYTPTGTGPDSAEIPIPYDLDGSGSLTWSVRRSNFRVQTAGGAPSTTIEKSTGTGAFNPTSIVTMTLPTGMYETGIFTGLGTVNSSDKIRFNTVTLASATNWTITLEISCP